MVNKLCISHDVGPDWALGYNLGYDLADEQHLHLCPGHRQGHQRSVGRVFRAVWGNGQRRPPRGFDAGLTLLSSDQWQWDISYGTGINHRMNYGGRLQLRPCPTADRAQAVMSAFL